MWSVILLLLSHLDGDFVQGELAGISLDADKEGKVSFLALGDTLCVKSRVAGGFTVLQVSDGVEEVRSVLAPSGDLLRCSVTADRALVESFMRACRLGLREQRAGPAGSELRFWDMDRAKTTCDQLHSGDAHRMPAHAQKPEDIQPGAGGAGEVQKLRRYKRGFTYPGTLWCGAGNIADDYGQLGEFSETDSCCRTHDHCPHIIHAFSSNYGYTNYKWHSLSHCACDNTLKDCLRAVNDTSSRVVGQAFFNVIEVPCFEFTFEEQCMERHWYGVCKRYEMVPVAVIKESIPYDFGGIEVIDVLTLAPSKTQVSEANENKQERAQSSESTTQSIFSGSQGAVPEEPSLTNVVTAAEDFIKVLATVSTSQSSSADTGKGDAQTSDRKRKKNAGKKKKDSKKRGGKGRGKKRKQKDRLAKAEEGFAGASSNKTEELISKGHLVEDHGNLKNFRKSNDNFMTGAFDSVGDTGHANKMMRDGYRRICDENQSSAAAETNAKNKEEMLESHKQIKETESSRSSSTAHIPSTIPSKPRSTRPRQRLGRKRHEHLTAASLPLEATLHNRMGDDSPLRATESSSLAGQTTHSPISPAREEAPQSSESWGEKGSAFIATTQNTAIVGTKRPRSRQRGGKTRRRKPGPPSSPILKEAPHALTAQDILELSPDVTQVLTVDLRQQPQSTAERRQPGGLENPAGTSVSSITISPGQALPKKRQHRLKGTRDRRRPVLANSTSKDTRLEDMITSVTSATTMRALPDSQSLPQIKNAEAATASSPLQTTPPSSLPQTNPARRRLKDRSGEKRRKNKT